MVDNVIQSLQSSYGESRKELKEVVDSRIKFFKGILIAK